MSASTSAREVVPFGVETIAVSSHSGAFLGTRFWKNELALGAVREALHERGPPARRAEKRLRDGEVVPDEVELRLPALREEDLVRARDRDVAPVDVEHVLVRHQDRTVAAHGASRCCVSFPPACCSDHRAAPDAERRAPCHDLLVAATVLIVDDHAGFRSFARALLEAEGFEVVGRRPTERRRSRSARALAPELVLLDVALPDMDGFAVCEALLEDGAGPAVVLTSSRDVSVVPPATRAKPGPRVHPEERALRPRARRARGRLGACSSCGLRCFLGAVALAVVGGVGLVRGRRPRPRRGRRRRRPRPRDLRDRRLGAARREPRRAAHGRSRATRGSPATSGRSCSISTAGPSSTSTSRIRRAVSGGGSRR